MENPGPSTALNHPVNYDNVSDDDSQTDESDQEEGFKNFITCPEIVLLTIFEKLPMNDLKTCRLICTLWNDIITGNGVLDFKSCFLFDGRKDDSIGGRCAEYMDSSPTKNTYWRHMRFRRVYGRQTTWFFPHLENDHNVSHIISLVELVNCSMNWTVILQILTYLPNVHTFIDRQDMYCWDYQTFNSGIDEDEELTTNPSFLAMRNRGALDNLSKIKSVNIHRSQLVECTTYLKILMLRCGSLRNLEVTTDQNFAPQRANSFYSNLFQLLKKNRNALKALKFPYKLVSPTYDFRVMDEHHCFREFVNHITEARWFETLKMMKLEEFNLQFGTIPVDNQDLKTKIVPFLLTSFPALKKFRMGCVLMESGMERFVDEFLRETEEKWFQVELGLYMNDAAGVPSIINLQERLRSLSVQTFRDMSKTLNDLIPLLGIDSYESLKEFQYFTKNHSFRNYNLDMLTDSFRNLTNLNLVDHNSRLETRHSCEALATIEDEDMQLIVDKLRKLECLQLITNMTYLTDSGLTGISQKACKRMNKLNQYVLKNGDILEGKPVSSLQNLKSLVLRGLGIKVTDVSAHFAFNDMAMCKKFHIYGSHQLTLQGRSLLNQKFSMANGCDLQVGSS